MLLEGQRRKAVERADALEIDNQVLSSRNAELQRKVMRMEIEKALAKIVAGIAPQTT